MKKALIIHYDETSFDVITSSGEVIGTDLIDDKYQSIVYNDSVDPKSASLYEILEQSKATVHTFNHNNKQLAYEYVLSILSLPNVEHHHLFVPYEYAIKPINKFFKSLT